MVNSGRVGAAQNDVECAILMEFADDDHSGTLDFAEFCGLIRLIEQIDEIEKERQQEEED